MSHDRIRALVALACDQSETEEGRTAAVQACGAREIAYLTQVAGKLRGELLGALAEIEPADRDPT